jgi:hypothetical protein
VSGAVTIRRAVAADARALERLAQLDCGRVPAGEVLVAEVGGELLAAVSVASGAVVADPFRRTADIVALLRVRAAQESSGDGRRPEPLRFLGVKRPSAARHQAPTQAADALTG